MTNNYLIHLIGKLPKRLMLFALFFIYFQTAFGQVGATYSFSNSTGPYNMISTATGATAVAAAPSGDDDTNWPLQNIGFTFTYNGNNYTQVGISSNGYLRLGATTATYYGNVLSSQQNTLSPFNGDLQGKGMATSCILIQTLGSAPNRVCVVQWRDWTRWGSGTYVGDTFNFQVRLHETGQVRFAYYNFAANTTGTGGYAIGTGINGTAVTDFNLRTGGTWIGGGTTGTANTQQMTIASNNLPDTGRIYTWAQAPMTLDSSYVTQVTTAVPAGASNQAIINVKVITQGGINPLSVSSMTFNTNGTTNTANITNARLFYTGSSSTFATTTQVGSVVVSPNGTFVVNGTRTLVTGENNFWLAYDVAPSSTNGNFLDAECTSVTVAGTPGTPVITAPAGARQIAAPLAGTYTVGATGNFPTITAAFNSAYSLGISGAVIFELIDPIYNSSTGEVFPIVVGNIPGSSFTKTITMRPAIGVSSYVFDNNAGYLMVFDGTRYVNIDGRAAGTGSNSLTIENRSTGVNSGVIHILNDARTITIRNTTFRGSNNTNNYFTAPIPGMVRIGGTNVIGGSGNDSITIKLNTFAKIGNLPYSTGVVFDGQEIIRQNDVAVIDSNNFQGWTMTGIHVSNLNSGNGRLFMIRGNSFYDTISSYPNTILNQYPFSAIYDNPSNANAYGHQITGNYIGGTSPQLGGFNGVGQPRWVIYHNTSTFPIWYSGSTTTAGTKISGNRTSNMWYMPPSLTSVNVYSYYISSGYADLTDNIVGNETDSNSIRFDNISGGNVIGYYMQHNTNTDIKRNMFTNVANYSNVSFYMMGIYYTNNSNGQVNIDSNTVRAIYNRGTYTGTGTTTSITGFYIANSSPTVNIRGNQVGGPNLVDSLSTWSGSVNYTTTPPTLTASTPTSTMMVGFSVTSGINTFTNNYVGNLYTNSIYSMSSPTNATILGLYLASGTNGQMVSNNTFKDFYQRPWNGSSYSTATSGVVGIYSASGAATIQNNTISNLNTYGTNTNTSISASLSGIAVSSSNIHTIANNSISELNNLWKNTSVSTQVNGIVTSVNNNNTITGNTIRDLTTYSSSTNGAINGIYNVSGSVNQIIDGNRIYNLISKDSLNNNPAIIGIQYVSSTTIAGNNSSCSRNIISGLVTTYPVGFAPLSAVQTGIQSNGGTAVFANNLIRLGRDTSGSPLVRAIAYRGIFLNSPSISASRVYHNNILIDASPDYGSGTSACMNVNGNASAPGYIDIRNNVFVNNSLNSGTATSNHYNYVFGSSTNLLTCNFDIISNAAGANNFVSRFNLIDQVALSDLRTLTGLAANTGFASPNFVNATGASSQVNLRINSPTPVEGNGDSTLASVITVDVDGNTRASLGKVDIGAHAGNFTLSSDVTAPAIYHTALPNAGSTANRTLTATIFDGQNIPRGANAPRVYYKKGFGTATWQSGAGTLLSGPAKNGSYNFVIDHTLAGGLSLGDTIFYYIIAQDSSAGNISSNPAGVLASNVNTITQHPTTIAGAFKYIYNSPIDSVIYVPNTVAGAQSYTTLTGPGGAFDAINNSALIKNTTIVINGSIASEPGTVQLNKWLESGVGGYSVTIRPDVGATQQVINGTYTGGALLRFNGISNLKILGYSLSGSTNDTNLLIRNTSTSTAVIQFLEGGSSDTLKNVIIEGNNTNTATTLGGLVNVNPSTLVNSFNNFLMQNCVIRKGSGLITLPAVGFMASGTVPRYVNAVTLNENSFYDINSKAVQFSTGTGNNIFVTNNHFYNKYAVHTSTTYTAIEIVTGANSDGNQISGNYIGGTDKFAAGTPWVNSTTPTMNLITVNTGQVTGTNIRNNVIQNFYFSSTGTTTFRGVLAQGTAAVYSINNNRIGASDSTTSINTFGAGSLTGIYCNGTGNVTISNDTILNLRMLPATVASTTIIGINSLSGASNVVTITNNYINGLFVKSNNTGTTTASALVGILSSNTTMNLNINNNNIRSLRHYSDGYGYACHGILVTSGAGNINNNNVYGLISRSNSTNTITSAPMSGIGYVASINATTNVNGNTVDSLSLRTIATSNSSSVYGIHVYNGGATITLNVNNNNVRNIFSNSISTSTGSTAALVGININSAGAINSFYNNNKVYNLNRAPFSAASVSMYGMAFTTSTATQGNNSFADRNLIHSMVSNSTSSPVLVGIYNIQGYTTFSNNVIRMGVDSSGTLSAIAATQRGIWHQSSIQANYWHNSVLLAGAPAIGTMNTVAFESNTSITSGQTLDVRNNIFANLTSNAGTAAGNNWGVRYYDSSRVNSNFNIIYTPGIGGKAANIGWYNTNYTLLGGDSTSFKAKTGMDLASASVDPNFEPAALGAASLFTMALQTSNPAEKSGDATVVVANDYYGNVRASNTPSDIGAHAGNFTQTPDAFPPSINYTAFTNAGSITGTRTLSGVVITDNNGIPMSGANRPKIYYSKDKLTWYSASANSVTGTATNATCSFVIDYLSFSPSLTSSDTVYYFVVAQDFAGNVQSNGIYAVGTDVNTLTQYPIRPNYYKFLPIIPANTVIPVGVGQTYTSLTNVGGVFEYLNSRTIGGNITIEVTSDLLGETGAVVLNQVSEDGTGAGTFSVTIRPNAGTVTPRVIEGNYQNVSSSNGLITLVAANRVKILGIPTGGNATQKLLLIRNTAATNAYTTATGNSVITVSSATGVVVRNCIIESGNSNTAGGSIEFRVGLNNVFPMVPCTYDTVDNNIMKHNTTATLPSGIPGNSGVYSFGNPNVYNNNIVITNNNISNYAVAGIGVVGNNGDGFVISGNSIYYDLPISVASSQQAIVFLVGTFSNGNVISGNYIGGSAANCGGSAHDITGNYGFTGIRTNVGNGASTLISNNTIQNIKLSNPAGGNVFYGIYAQAGSTIIDNNQIGHPTITNSITYSQQSAMYCIYYQGTNEITVSNNKVQGISMNTGNVFAQFLGIYIPQGRLMGITGNTIGHATTPNSITFAGISTNYCLYASVLNAYVESYPVSNNTIANITTTGNGTGSILYGMYTANSSRPLIYNNNIYNLACNGISTAVSGVVNALYVGVGTGTIPEIVGNNIYGIRATNPGTSPTVANGIYQAGGQNALYSKNRIYDITNASTSVSLNPAPAVAAMNLLGMSINTNILNNQISLGAGITNNVQINGIWVNTSNSGVVVNAINNSIVIEGTASAGNQNTHALLRGNNTLTEFNTYLNLRNNIFANRRTGGSGSHFAIANQASAPTNTTWSANSSNYNLFVSPNASAAAQWGSSNVDINSWRSSALSDVFTYYVPAGTGVGQLNLSNLFVSTTSGNLNLNPASPEVWYVYGKGITGSIINNLNTDFAGNTRSTSQGFATTIGSFHMVSAPSTLPVAATASASPAANTSTSYTFASRPVATITWGASAPTGATVYDFTGVTPPSAPTGNAFNRYVRADLTGGTAPFNYGLTLNFNPANIGGVNNSNNIRIATASSVATPVWVTQNTTISNATTLSSNVSGLTNPTSAILMTGTELSAPPTILRFIPVAREIGGNVSIVGSLFTGATAISFNGTSQPTFTVVNDTLITTTVPLGATTGLVTVTNPFGTGTSITNFVVIGAPTVLSFNPIIGTRGTAVTITGTGFTYATQVNFNGISATFTIVDDNTITTTVPLTATTGNITVVNPAGTGTSASPFTVVLAPTVTLFTPSSGPVGTTVSISGTNFQFVTNVKFNGLDASYTVNSTTSITAYVPTGATTGLVSVTNGSGTGNSATNFTVIQLPTITGFIPSSGGIGTIVTISGTNFASIDSVEFGGGINATFTVNSNSQITATVNAGSVTGPIVIYRNGVTAVVSSSNFTVISDLIVSTVQTVSGTYNNITVTGTGNAVLIGNLFALGNTTIQTGGTMNLGTNQMQGNGNFVTNSGSRLIIGSPEGISATGALTGNVLMGGTRTYHVSGSYTYNGATAQVTGNGLTNVDTLIINNTNGVLLSVATNVNKQLNLTSGNLMLGNNDLTVGATGNIVGAGASAYVLTNGNGSLRRTVANNATAVVYPVGSTLSYTPASIQQTVAGTADIFSVRVMNGVYSNGTSGLPYTANVVNRTWMINEAVAGGSNATVGLTWDDTLELTSFVRSFSAVAYYNTSASSWFSSTYGAATGSNPYTRTRAGLNTFGAFGVGDISGTLPVEMISFTGAQMASDVVLKWTTANEINNSHFDVERSMDGIHYVKIGTVKAAGNTNRTTNYNFVDEGIANAVAAGTVYYRLNQNDLDGKNEMFGPVLINLSGTNEEVSMNIYPNPFRDQLEIEFNNTENGLAEVSLMDIQGRVVKTIELNVLKGYNTYSVSGLDELKDGIYFMNVTIGGLTHQQKLVKTAN